MSYKAQKSSVSAAVKQLQSSPHHQLSLSKTFSLSLSIFPYPFHSQLQFHLPPSTHSFPQMQTPPYWNRRKMPLVRVQVKNEFGLGKSDLYVDSNNEDPKAVLDGVAVAGLVGILRQLGDLAEYVSRFSALFDALAVLN